MVNKTISITEETYEALLLTDKEEEAIRIELSKGWHLIQERISSEMSRY